MANTELLHHLNSKYFSGPNRTYPTIPGLYRAAASFQEAVEGTNLTDKLGLAGTLLIFPEFSEHRNRLQHVITLGHQIDHYFDYSQNNPKALLNFNSLYPELLIKHYGKDNLLVKSLLGFFSQAMVVEKETRNPHTKNLVSENIQYRELINAIWVRMIVSLGTRLSGGNNDTISLLPVKHLDKIYGDYKNYIEGTDITDIPAGEKSHTLFLWTMAIQQKYDSISRYRNRINQNPFMEKTDKDYASLAIKSGVNPFVLHATLKSIELLPYLQKFQRF